MIRIGDINIINIGRINLPPNVYKYNYTNNTKISNISKLSKIIIKCVKQSILNSELFNSASDSFKGDKFLLDHIVSYTYNPPYETILLEKTKYILPVIKSCEENNGWYNIYGTNDMNNSIVWKFDNKIISVIQSTDIQFSHIVSFNNIEYACLTINKLPDLHDIKRTYTTVFHLMKQFNHEMNDKMCLDVLNDWFEKEISDFIFRICLMTKETINSHMNYIQNDIVKNMKIIDLSDVCNPDLYNSDNYMINE